jgi:hypothetical protein
MELLPLQAAGVVELVSVQVGQEFLQHQAVLGAVLALIQTGQVLVVQVGKVLQAV